MDIRTDGTNGVDNSFGNIVFAQQALPFANASLSATDAIAEGEGSLVIAFSDLGAASNYGSVKAQLVPVRMVEGKEAGNAGLCGSAYESVAEQLRQVVDTPSSGTHDPAIVCDEISVGLGFKAVRTGPFAAAVAPPMDGGNPCQ